MIEQIREIDPTVYDGVSSTAELLKLAKNLGTPIRLKGGSFVKRLTVAHAEAARINSLSGRFGTGFFPFHTDTSFWDNPARLVLLRGVSGDLARPTLITPFAPIIEEIGEAVVRQAAWICDTGNERRFTTTVFERDGRVGIRYDPNCMRPANRAAHVVDDVLRPRCFTIEGNRIDWIPNRVVVIPNWTHLHARGRADSEDGSRLLERVYLQ